MLSLALFMLRILANNKKTAAALYELAVIADLFY